MAGKTEKAKKEGSGHFTQKVRGPEEGWGGRVGKGRVELVWKSW